MHTQYAAVPRKALKNKRNDSDKNRSLSKKSFRQAPELLKLQTGFKRMLPLLVRWAKTGRRGALLRPPDAPDQEPPETGCGAKISDMACSSITNLGIPMDPGATSYSSKTMTRLPDSSR